VTHGFQQQDPGIGYAVPKSVASPQHGQPPPKQPLKIREPRVIKPRPGH